MRTISTQHCWTVSAVNRHFYGMVELNAVRAKIDFATIVDEVIQQFSSKFGVEVSVTVEIEARCKEGFDDILERAVKENCNVLKFKNAEFESGQ